MLKLGLTGSIATGKSTVLDAFAARGVPTFSADEAVHQLYRGAAVPLVEKLFPGVTKGGEVDRAALSQRLVGHTDRLKALEDAVHPLVREKIAAFLAEAESTGAPLAVVDIPLLFESGYDYGLDQIAVTIVGEAIQRERALRRAGMSVEKLEAILARQMPQAEKVERANYVFDTAGTIEQTRDAVAWLVDTLSTPDDLDP